MTHPQPIVIGYVLYQWREQPTGAYTPRGGQAPPVEHQWRDHRHDDTPQFIVRIEFMCRNGLETMGLTVRATNTFLEVKEQIQGNVNVPANQQLLVLWRSERLVTYVEDDQKLSDYNIDYTSLLIGTYLGLA